MTPPVCEQLVCTHHCVGCKNSTEYLQALQSLHLPTSLSPAEGGSRDEDRALGLRKGRGSYPQSWCVQLGDTLQPHPKEFLRVGTRGCCDRLSIRDSMNCQHQGNGTKPRLSWDERPPVRTSWVMVSVHRGHNWWPVVENVILALSHG